MEKQQIFNIVRLCRMKQYLGPGFIRDDVRLISRKLKLEFTKIKQFVSSGKNCNENGKKLPKMDSIQRPVWFSFICYVCPPIRRCCWNYCTRTIQTNTIFTLARTNRCLLPSRTLKTTHFGPLLPNNFNRFGADCYG